MPSAEVWVRLYLAALAIAFALYGAFDRTDVEGAGDVLYSLAGLGALGSALTGWTIRSHPVLWSVVPAAGLLLGGGYRAVSCRCMAGDALVMVGLLLLLVYPLLATFFGVLRRARRASSQAKP